ncbi:Auxin-responsive protein saur72 [Asimina triloba]
MKQLIRRFARVADSASVHYAPLHTDVKVGSKRKWRLRRSSSRVVPVGHVPVYVGEEMERFVVSAELLNRPVFAELLRRSAQEYGYEQKGVLRIPCRVGVFERVLEVLKKARDGEVEEMALFSDEDFL